MAGLKVSELPQLNYPVPDDVLLVVHSDGTTQHTMQTSVQNILDILTPFDVSSFTVTPSSALIGTTISSVLLSWKANKQPSSISVTPVGDVSPQETSVVYSSPITTDTTFTIGATGPDGKTVTKSATITFSSYSYYGVLPVDTYTEDDITSLTREQLNSINKDVNYDCSGGNYFVYAYPVRFGPVSSQTTVNSIPWSDWVQSIINITNQNGYSEDYYVYRSFNKLFGNYIPVKWR